MAKLGFLGLGIMGYPMARHLLEAGHEVALWSHTPAKAVELAASHGALACPTPREVGEGAVVVDASTVSPSASRRIAAALGARGIHFLDAPCTGSRAGAEGGTLTFMIGGAREVLERVGPYLECMGKQFYYCGGPGLGLAAKLTQNIILSNIMQAFNEGLVLSTKAGVDPELRLEILHHSAARCGLIASKAPAVFNRDFSTNFSLKWMHKDICLALDSGKDLNVPLPLTGLNQQMFQAGVAKGLGEEDFCSGIKVLEDWAGVEVKGREK